MIFEGLSDKILGSIKKLKGQNKISESNVEDAIKEIRMSYLKPMCILKLLKTS